MIDETEIEDGTPFSIQINNPSNGTPVPHAALPTNGDYGGPVTSGVLVECVLGYSNPPGGPFSNGKHPPEDPANQAWNRQFNNVPATQPGQLGLLTAFLYDASSLTLLAQSSTISVQIV